VRKLFQHPFLVGRGAPHHSVGDPNGPKKSPTREVQLLFESKYVKSVFTKRSACKSTIDIYVSNTFELYGAPFFVGDKCIQHGIITHESENIDIGDCSKSDQIILRFFLVIAIVRSNSRHSCKKTGLTRLLKSALWHWLRYIHNLPLVRPLQLCVEIAGTSTSVISCERVLVTGVNLGREEKL
jgi:hypothetical protein